MDISVILLSVGSLIISTLLAATSHILFKNQKNVKPIYILLAGAFIATLIIMLYVDYKPDIHGGKTTFFLAVVHSIQVMLLGYDFEFLYEAIQISNKYADLGYFYLSVLFFLTPVYTFGFVLSFFESITSYVKYLFKWRSDIYILSDLSEKSMVLATSIRKKFPKSLIIFADETSNEYASDLISDSKKIKAVHFKKHITDIGMKFHKKSSKATFFAINEDESANLESALHITDKFSNRQNTELYVFSTSKEGQLLLDSAKKGFMKVRRINENKALAYSTLRTKPLLENHTVCNEKKILSTLIVGFGGYGSELTKALLWCCQLPGFELKLNVIDKNPYAESQFRAECPEIMLLNGNTEFGEACYTVNFYNGTDAGTYEFNKIISTLTDTSVVYVSLGNDELNIETAINIRILFERIGVYPVIRAVVYSKIRCHTLSKSSLVNHQGKSYDIEIIGNIDERFSYDTIISEELEAMALKCHLRWSDSPEEIKQATEQFNEYEYFRNSSMASAIHDKYRESEKLTGETATITEHMRWNAYMRTEGYVFSGSLNKETRNDRAKMHHNLHRFGLLSNEDIEKDRRIVSDN